MIETENRGNDERGIGKGKHLLLGGKRGELPILLISNPNNVMIRKFQISHNNLRISAKPKTLDKSDYSGRSNADSVSNLD